MQKVLTDRLEHIRWLIAESLQGLPAPVEEGGADEDPDEHSAHYLRDVLRRVSGAAVTRCLIVTCDTPQDPETLCAAFSDCVPPTGQLDHIRWTDRGDCAEPQPGSPYDAIFFLDPAWGRCAVHSLDWARLRLRDGGVLCVVGQMSAGPPTEPRDNVPSVVSYLQAQALRCGFGPIHWEGRAEAAPTGRRYLESGATSVPPPEPDVGHAIHLEDPPGDGVTSMEKAQSALPDNAHLCVACCQKERPPRWTLRPLAAGDAEAMRALFAEVFAPNAMSSAHWHWKYGYGRGLGITAWSGGKMIAFYGGVRRKVSLRGRPDQAIQIVDVMVHAGERGILRRQGAFFLTAATFLECHLGYGTRSALGYGFPTARALKIAERLGLYEAVDSVFQLTWPCEAVPIGWRYKLIYVEGIALRRHKGAIDRLWCEMQASLSDAIVGYRDWEYIRRRFADHPDKDYEYLLLRRGITGRPLALVILAIEAPTCHVRDYVGDIRWLGIAIALLRGYASKRGLTHLSTRITSGFLACFPSEGRRDEAMDIAIPHNAWSEGLNAEEVRGRWWLMPGDTDFL